jgi:hypothetical protein
MRRHRAHVDARAIACINTLGPEFGSTVEWRHTTLGATTTGATLLGAVAAEDIPDDATMLASGPHPQRFDQYVKRRPVRISQESPPRWPGSTSWTWSWSARTSRASTPRSAAHAPPVVPSKRPVRRRCSRGDTWAEQRRALRPHRKAGGNLTSRIATGRHHDGNRLRRGSATSSRRQLDRRRWFPGFVRWSQYPPDG